MNNRLIVNYSPGSTLLHRLNGLTKVMGFIVLTVLIIVNYDVRIMGPCFALCSVGVITMRPNWKPIIFVVCFMTVMTGVIGSLLIVVFAPDSDVRYVGGSNVLLQFSDSIYVSRELLWYFAGLYLKRMTSLVSSLLFILSITPSELAAGLNGVGVPYKICTIVAVAFRTIHDIARDFSDIKDSMMMRGLELDSKHSSLSARLRGNVMILVPLIITSFSRVDTIANAMDLRGYGKAPKRTWYSEHPPGKGDKVARGVIALLTLLTLAYIVFFRIVFPRPYTYWSPWY